MSAAHDGSDDEKKNISVRVDKKKVDEFDRAIKKAQIEGDLPMDFSRADALRRLMQEGIEDPSLFSTTEGEDGGNGE